MNLVSIITFVIVGLGTTAGGAKVALCRQVMFGRQVEPVVVMWNISGAWYMSDTIRIRTYSDGVRTESDTTIILSQRRKP
jgi:hypothetical protein